MPDIESPADIPKQSVLIKKQKHSSKPPKKTTKIIPGPSVQNIVLTPLPLSPRGKLYEEDQLTGGEKNLSKIAKLNAKTKKPSQYQTLNPKFYKKHLKKAKSLQLNEQREMNDLEKGLTVISRKTEGASTGEFAEQAAPKRGHQKPTKYMLKSGSAEEHLSEVIGAKFYAYYAGPRGTIVPKTRFVTRENENRVDTGSRFIEGFQDYYDISPIIKNDRLVVKSENGSYVEVKGYIAMLAVAKFIQDPDCMGHGANAGYANYGKTRADGSKVYPNVKIDPGRSFGFINHSTASDPGALFTVKLEREMHEKPYHTNLPLEFIDPKDPKKLNPKIGGIKVAVEHLYPNFDTRDLLTGEITYAEICHSPKLYKQLAKTVEAIVNTSDEDLYRLVNNKIPDVINGTNLRAHKDEIYNQMLKRKLMMHKLYAQEIEFMKLYHEAKRNNQDIDFEAFKVKALENAQKIPFPKVDLLGEKTDFTNENHRLMHAAFTTKNKKLFAQLAKYPHDLAESFKNKETGLQENNLVTLIRSNKIDYAKYIIRNHPNINSSLTVEKTQNDRQLIVESPSILAEAIATGNIIFVKEVLDRKPDINKESFTQIITHNNYNVLQEEILTSTPITEAIYIERTDIIQELLKHRPNLDQVISSERIDYSNDVKERRKSTPILEAINTNNQEVVSALLSKPNLDISNSLILTVKKNDIEAVEIILSYQPNFDLNKEINGTTLLKEAQSDKKMVKFLKEHGARDKGFLSKIKRALTINFSLSKNHKVYISTHDTATIKPNYSGRG